MSMQVGELFAEIGLDQSLFDKGLKSAENKFRALGSKLTSIGKTMTLGVTMPIVGAATASFKLASDMNESINKVDVAFKTSAQGVKDWSKNTLTQFGIAKGTALDMAAGYGDMATSMGLTTAQAADMSTSLVGLGGDLASFKNKGIAEVNTALNGIFTGETESLKMLGIVMTQANLEEYAASMGIEKKIKDMTQAEQVQLRYNYVMSKTTNAQGDFARTQGGAANQMRIFSESLKELGASFGENLLPVITPIITKINELIKSFGNLSPEAKKTITAMAGIAAAVGPILIVAGSLAGAFVKISEAFSVFSKISKGASFLSKAGMLFNPWVLGIALVIGAIYLLWKNWDKIKTWLINSWEKIKQKTSSIWNGIKDFFTKWGPDILIALTGPIGWIVALIVKNWDKIKTNTVSAWNSIKDFIANIGTKIKSVFTDLVSGAYNWGANLLGKFWDGIKSKFDTVVSGVSSIGKTIKAAIKGEEVYNAATMGISAEHRSHLTVGSNASGTNYWQGGLTWVGEQGPELLNLPRGSQIYNNGQSMAMLNGTQTVKHTGEITVRGVNDMDQLVGVTKIIAREFERGNRRIPARVTTMPSMP
ncbi:MAG: hypothetical protein PHU36_08640 [Syntrophomonadaceae bacterium]|nr:hypothetical protein [Syntrophomonadaceae bacterium]